MTGGRGQIRLKMSQLKMPQLGLRGGRVKLIETMSQYLQFFFLAGFPKVYSNHRQQIFEENIMLYQVIRIVN